MEYGKSVLLQSTSRLQESDYLAVWTSWYAFSPHSLHHGFADQTYVRLQQNIQQMHRDHIPEVPEGCELLASTPVCKNQGFVRYAPGSVSRTPKDIEIFTIQGHPEFTENIVRKIVDLRSSTGVIDQSTAESARARAKWRNDGVDVIGKAIWQILDTKAK